jgi:hypothetical protein
MAGSIRLGYVSATALLCAPLLLCAAAPTASAQVFVVQPQHIEQHYSNFNPTSVKLPPEPMTTIGRERLIRFMQSEQGFAMRPLPIAPVDLQANGTMSPNGEKYIDMLHAKGISAKPGDRLVVTNIQIRDNRIVLDLNNGPFHKHRFLRHVSIGMDPYSDNSIVPDDGAAPTGSRITLTFQGRVPDLTGEQLEALLKPMIDFGVKSPAEAYSESLPDFLRKAIMEHRVLIGMDKDMVIYAKGQPGRKDREEVDGKNVEIWIYGEAPQPVEFVRFDGNFVVRTELAKVGEAVQVQTQNQMGDFYPNKPVVAANQHEVQLGDRTSADVDQENAPKGPPSLRNPGEKLPADSDKSRPTMAPVNYPPGMQRPGDPGYSPTVSAQQPNGSNGSSQKQQGSAQSSGSSSDANPLDPPPQSSQKPQH